MSNFCIDNGLNSKKGLSDNYHDIIKSFIGSMYEKSVYCT